MRLLIVEDNREMRRLIKQIAQKWCDESFECENGAQALEAFRTYQPDWVLMDIEMPEMDGITATRQIVNNFPEARIAIVTDSDTETLREAALEAGACNYIVKENLLSLRNLFTDDKND